MMDMLDLEKTAVVEDELLQHHRFWPPIHDENGGSGFAPRDLSIDLSSEDSISVDPVMAEIRAEELQIQKFANGAGFV